MSEHSSEVPRARAVNRAYVAPVRHVKVTISRCAVGTCRQLATVTLVKDDVRLKVCSAHARVYRGQGYKDEETRS